MRISDWSSDVCSSDLIGYGLHLPADLEADRRYRYHSEHGARPVAVAEAGAYRGLSLVELRDGQFSSTATRADARRLLRQAIAADRKGAVEGKECAGRVDLGGRRIIKKKKKKLK